MKRSVQILLLFACLVPLCINAREETMEERKRRITRKYLRERMDITYSEEMVPGASDEDEDVLASEMFKELQVDLERQEPGAAIPPPVRPPAAPLVENQHWLLSEEDEADDPYAVDDPFAPEDPYAMDDPFAPKESKREPRKTDWGTERNSAPYSGTQRESRFNRRDQDSARGQQSDSYDSPEQGIFGPRNPRASSDEGVQPGFPQQDPRSFGSSAGQDPSRRTTFGPTFNQERQQSPFPRAAGSSTDRSYGLQQQPRTGGYAPYKSPYETQREQRRQQWGSGYSEPKQEYQRPDTFQQWKKKNEPRFDPTSDDAFIEEMRPKTRR
ncbi:MAG: hypothetical protein DRP64_03855 [Verrucomicrobia bacterium]|nr:MAG: hypothetical protein DRP64_03855 [Verrucomicrobiota bacterium]